MKRIRNLRPVNRALNEETTLAGVDYRYLLGILVLSVFIYKLVSLVWGLVILFGLPLTIKAITRKDNRLLEVIALSVFFEPYYDAGKR